MITSGPSAGTSSDERVRCPSCGKKGRSVKPITVESLVTDAARNRLGRTDGFRFCSEPSCDVAYFHPETGDRFSRRDVNVRIGRKETSPPRPICYCFGHIVEEIEDEVAKTGTSRVPDEITEKCRQGLDRCEETNPQGACCLCNVRQAVKDAQAKRVGAIRGGWKSRIYAGTLAQIGALASAVVASACCWLPLLLIAGGISAGALSATLEAWRPVLLPATLVLLSLAFYFTYRKPKAAAQVAAGTGEACCAMPGPDANSVACCPADKAKGFTLQKLNKAILWVVAVFVLALAFFPNYVGYFLEGGQTLSARDDLQKVVVKIEGMTCEACAASIEYALRNVPGVAAVEVSYSRREAVVGIPKGSEISQGTILTAIAGAGEYAGRFANQVEWTLTIAGMTCEGCAVGLQAALSSVPGVSGASVNYNAGRATITGNASVTEGALQKAVSKAGFSVTSMTKQ